jgi:hypothetical protein
MFRSNQAFGFWISSMLSGTLTPREAPTCSAIDSELAINQLSYSQSATQTEISLPGKRRQRRSSNVGPNDAGQLSSASNNTSSRELGPPSPKTIWAHCSNSPWRLTKEPQDFLYGASILGKSIPSRLEMILFISRRIAATSPCPSTIGAMATGT